MSDLTLHLTDDEWRAVRAAVAERRFDRAMSLRRSANDGHDDCCEKARARRAFAEEVDAALRAEVATLDAVLSRLPAYDPTT